MNASGVKLRRLVERLLLASRADRLGRWRRRGHTLVLAYHNIVPTGQNPCGDRSLHLPQAVFAAQLDTIAATHDVVPLAAIDAQPRDGRPRVVITFDDAYRGALTAGLHELALRGLPATVFVAPGLLGTTTWWDRLAEHAGGEIPRDVREQALSTHGGSTQHVAAAFGTGAALPSWAAIATEQEVLAAASMAGVTLGAHSWSHPNLTVLRPEDLAAECRRPIEWLARIGRRTEQCWLAYPYGLSSRAVAIAAAAAGYAGALRVDGGWLPLSKEPRFELPRFNVPSGLSLEGFRLRVAGILTR